MKNSAILKINIM